METPKWSELFTAEELASVLDVHHTHLAKLHGEYSLAADIKLAAQCIRDLSERCETGARIAEALDKLVGQVLNKTQTALESLP